MGGHIFRLALLAIPLCLAACATPSPSPGAVVVDDVGDTVRLAAPARRIASLQPTTTELLFAIGAGDRVVGRTAWCDAPLEARTVPSLGDGLSPNLEAIVAATPDLVLLYPSALNRLSKPRLKTNFAVWVEDLTAEELARVLARLGSDDKKAVQARPQPDGQFSKMVLNPLSDADRKELAQLLRADLRPVTAAKPAAKAERLALLVAYNPERPQAGSPQLKRYFDSRRPLHTGGLQALLVLREARN